MTARLLGPCDEPQASGVVVAVHYGDYRRQELWVSSGANIGSWYPLGGEFGRPKVWVDQRSPLEKLASHGPEPRPGPGEVPLHPCWSDVLARGPVTLLVPAGDAAYRAGWRAGRQHLVGQMEEAAYDEPDGHR